MSNDDVNIKEDMSTTVSNVQGLTSDPIGLKSKSVPKYKKDNEKTKRMKLSFKEWIESRIEK